MTMLFSTPTTAHPVLVVRRSRLVLIPLWVTQVAVAALFTLAGGLKLTGVPEMVALFDAIGVGQWFRYVTGSIEVISAVALLIPSLAPFGALVLVPTMFGAIATHLFVVGGSAAPATVLLVASLAIAWARRDQLADAVARLR
jgi:putative oxidoreductase